MHGLNEHNGVMPRAKLYTSPPFSSAELFTKAVSPRMNTSDDSAYIAPDSKREEARRTQHRERHDFLLYIGKFGTL